jgi:hypothetical protein
MTASQKIKALVDELGLTPAEARAMLTDMGEVSDRPRRRSFPVETRRVAPRPPLTKAEIRARQLADDVTS